MFRQRASSSVSLIALGVAISGGFVVAQDVWAQGGRRIMVVNSDDGQGASFNHFSMPDIMELREPDFVRSDVPIFKEKLVLSEPQTVAIQRQIDVYLDALNRLQKELLSFPGAEPMAFTFPGGGHGEDGEAPAGAMVFVPTNGAELPEIDLDELGHTPGMGMEVGVRMTAGGEEDIETDGESSVSVSFRTTNDEEIPEELRKELEKRAQEMVEKITQQLEEQRANGQAAGDQPAIPAIAGLGDIDQFHQRQQDMLAAAKVFRKAKSDLRQDFVVEAQSTLSTAQVERWPALERALLREKSLPKGRLSGERTDLFKALKNVEVSPDSEIASQLDRYDLELDAALRQRNETLEDVGPKVDAAMQKKEFAQALTILDRASAARVAVRSINERHVEACASLLSPAEGTKLRETVLKAAYPQVYRETFADKTFAAATQLPGLDEKSNASLKQLAVAYRSEREEMDTRIRRAIDKHQPDEPRRPIEQMQSMLSEGGPREISIQQGEDPIREALNKRRELDERYSKSIAGVLTPAQIEQLPKPAPRRQAGQPIIIRRSSGE